MNDDELSLRAETTAPVRDRGDVALLTDPELVAQIWCRSHAALAEVYNRHGGPTHSLAAQLCDADADADDIVQHIFLGLWDQPGHFDANRGSLRSYLMQQIRSRAIDPVRVNGSPGAREAALRVERNGLAADDEALARMAGERSWSLLARLDEGRRSAIALAHFGGHTYREVAVLLAVPESIVKSRIRQGLTELGQSIELRNANT